MFIILPSRAKVTLFMGVLPLIDPHGGRMGTLPGVEWENGVDQRFLTRAIEAIIRYAHRNRLTAQYWPQTMGLDTMTRI